jgi:hypothetical protein
MDENKEKSEIENISINEGNKTEKELNVKEENIKNNKELNEKNEGNQDNNNNNLGIKEVNSEVDKINFSDINLEKMFTHNGIPVNKLKQIIFRAEDSVGKILLNNKSGTFFLCKIPFPDKSNLLRVLFTCSHVLDEKDLVEGKFIISFKDDMTMKTIKLSTSRKIYTNIELDITIIEIIKSEDEINEEQFLEIDDSDSMDILDKKNVYLFHFQNGSNLHISFATINSLRKNSFLHCCNSDKGSSGGPIFNSFNNKVYGIHTGSHKLCHFNLGIKLKEPIEQFYIKYNDKIKKKLVIMDENKEKSEIENTSINEGNKTEKELNVKEENIKKNKELNEKNEGNQDNNNKVENLDKKQVNNEKKKNNKFIKDNNQNFEEKQENKINELVICDCPCYIF